MSDNDGYDTRPGLLTSLIHAESSALRRLLVAPPRRAGATSSVEAHHQAALNPRAGGCMWRPASSVPIPRVSRRCLGHAAAGCCHAQRCRRLNMSAERRPRRARARGVVCQALLRSVAALQRVRSRWAQAPARRADAPRRTTLGPGARCGVHRAAPGAPARPDADPRQPAVVVSRALPQALSLRALAARAARAGSSSRSSAPAARATGHASSASPDRSPRNGPTS